MDEIKKREILAAELADASEFLAKTTENSADLLAKETEISVRNMRQMTIVLIAIGFIQIAIALTTLLEL